MVWTTKVRLSLLGIVALPLIFFLSLSDLQQAIFVSRAAPLAGGLVLGLILGLVTGFISWRARPIKQVFVWVSVSYYVLFGLGLLARPELSSAVFGHQGERDLIAVLPFFGLWLLVFWCAWILIRDVALQLIFGPDVVRNLKAPVLTQLGDTGLLVLYSCLLLLIAHFYKGT